MDKIGLGGLVFVPVAIIDVVVCIATAIAESRLTKKEASSCGKAVPEPPAFRGNRGPVFALGVLAHWRRLD